MTNEFAINILEQYREKPTLINEIETVEEAVWLDEALAMGVQALKQKSKTGHWIKYGKLYQCSECKELSCCQGKFCNECGTKMIEPQERNKQND